MIIDETGFFEWDGENSEKPAVGHLTIEDNGKIQLEMLAKLPGDAVFTDLFNWVSVENKTIRGVLKQTGRTVLLHKLKARPGYLGQEIFFNFIAERCFVSDDSIALDKLVGLSLPLHDLEEWYLPGNINTSEQSEDMWVITLEKTGFIMAPGTRRSKPQKSNYRDLSPQQKSDC